MSATTLAGLKDGLVPKPVAKEILTRATEASVVQRLSGQTAVPLEGAAIAVQTGHIEAGVVGEGEAKPVGSTQYGVKFIKPIKVAAITVYSKELRMKNPAGLLENIKGDLAGAVTRAFDLATLFGRNALTGAQIAGVESVNSTTNRVQLGTAAANKGGLTADILAGYDLVVNGEQVNNDFTGFAAHPRLRTQLMSSVDVQGRPVYQQAVDLRSGMDSLLGLPAAYGRVVNGKVGASTETPVRAFGGDWGALKYGFSEEMTMSISNQATVVDGDKTYNLWQQNMEAILVEAIFGWVITDPQSFVAYEQSATPPAQG